ncbi:STAS domain-containing protein [Micromonospora coerulea]
MHVVHATGEIDLETAPALRAALTAAVQGHPAVCCDLSGVTFCCAAGVTVLLEAAHEAARAGRRFSVEGARGVTARVLHATGVDRLLSGDADAVRAARQEEETPVNRSAAPGGAENRHAVTGAPG